MRSLGLHGLLTSPALTRLTGAPGVPAKPFPWWIVGAFGNDNENDPKRTICTSIYHPRYKFMVFPTRAILYLKAASLRHVASGKSEKYLK